MFLVFFFAFLVNVKIHEYIFVALVTPCGSRFLLCPIYLMILNVCSVFVPLCRGLVSRVHLPSALMELYIDP